MTLQRFSVLGETPRTVTITINTDNAAFAAGHEIARILRTIADQFEQQGTAPDPRDINGNIVGNMKIE